MSINNVSFIGLGVMGYPMAGHLQKNGYNVTVFNRTETKSEKWISEFKGQMALPARLRWGGVHNDAQPGIGALAQADHGDVLRHLHFFQCHTESIGMGREDEVAAVLVALHRSWLEVGRVEPLGIHHCAWHVAEDQKFLGR